MGHGGRGVGRRGARSLSSRGLSYAGGVLSARRSTVFSSCSATGRPSRTRHFSRHRETALFVLCRHDPLLATRIAVAGPGAVHVISCSARVFVGSFGTEKSVPRT